MKGETKDLALGGGLFLAGGSMLLLAAVEALRIASGTFGAGSLSISGSELGPWWPALLVTAAAGLWIAAGHGHRVAVAIAALWMVAAIADLVLNGRLVLLGPSAVGFVIAVLRHREWRTAR